MGGDDAEEQESHQVKLDKEGVRVAHFQSPFRLGLHRHSQGRSASVFEEMRKAFGGFS